MEHLVAPAAAAFAAVALVVAIRRTTMTTRRRPTLARWSWGTRWAETLERAGVSAGIDTVAGVTVAVATSVGLLASWVGISRPVVACLAVSVPVGGIFWLRSADQVYIRRVGAQMPLVAQNLAAALAAGLSLRQALQRAPMSVPRPVSDELAHLARHLQYGTRIETTLIGFRERLPHPAVRLVVAAISIQRTVGGNLADALTQLAGHLDERDQLARESRSATAQARMSAWLVAGLPVAAGIAVELAAPGSLEQTLNNGIGRVVLAGGLLSQCTGIVMIRRLSQSSFADGE